MEFKNLTFVISDGIATLTLNRPDRLNALSGDLQRELIRASMAVAGLPARAVVIRGAGRAFCSGVDIAILGDLNAKPISRKRMYASFDLGGEMADAIEAIPQVTIAALHGVVVGGGLVLAAACDLRVAAADTVFSIPEVDLGIPLAWGGIERLVREFGPARTKELVMTCRRFTPEEAMAAGFLNEIVAPGDVSSAAHELARTIAAKPRLPIAVTKEHVAEVLAGDTSRDDARSAADTLNDPESIAARALYLADFATRQ